MVFHHRHRNLYIFGGQRRRKHTMDFITYDVDAGELNILDLDTTTVGERNVARNAREENMDAAADINPRLLENLELVLQNVGLWVQRIQGDANNPRGLQSTPIYHHQVDTLSYPLIFHTGRGGWNFDLRSLLSDHKVTFSEFVRFFLSERLANGSPLLNYGRLLQQIICDWGHRQEQLNLRFLRALQLKRVEFNVYRDMQEQIFGENLNANYIPVDGQNDDVPVLNYGRGVNVMGNEPPTEAAEVATAAAAAGDDVLNRRGVVTLLPSSFSGSPRNMTQKYSNYPTNYPSMYGFPC
ncbi:hypothetical protein DMENIID0001_005570 [Sergentomyia squamirostris]